ncbi:ATP-dependent RNA helicase [Dirofilaria immitis]
MHSNNITNNYDCTPLLTNDDGRESSADQSNSANSRSWFKRIFNSMPLFEKSRSSSDSDCQWNNSHGQQYGANGGSAYNRAEKIDTSDHSTKSVRIYWRVI